MIDLHNHSSESSQCSKIDGAMMARRYVDRPDIQAFCTTDHLSRRNLTHLAPEGATWGSVVEGLCRGHQAAVDAARGEMCVFFGFEYGIGYNDFLIYGLSPNELVQMDFLFAFDDAALARLKQVSPSVAIIQAHPFRARCCVAAPELLHGVEVYNGMFFHDNENARARKFARETRLPGTGGTDCHEDDVGRMMTSFDGEIASNAALGQAIRRGEIRGFRIKDVVRDEFIPYASIYEEEP